MRHSTARFENGSHLPSHPATTAWLACSSDARYPRQIETLRSTSSNKAAIVRLVGAGPDDRSVIAKRAPQLSAAVERTFYEVVLPSLELSRPAYFGSVEDGVDHCWIFLEDAGNEKPSFRNLSDQREALEWLVKLHTSSLDTTVVARLPTRGAAHYGNLLSTALASVSNCEPGAGASPTGPSLDRLKRALETVSMNWSSLERLSASLPQGLVHGDFKEKNVRLVPDRTGRRVVAFDWENAGWGIAGLDFWRFDTVAYCRLLSEQDGSSDAAPISAMRALGQVFFCLDAICWLIPDLELAVTGNSDPWSVEKLQEQIPIYSLRLEDASAELGRLN